VDQLQRRVVAASRRNASPRATGHQELSDALARTERMAGRGGDLLREQNREIEAVAAAVPSRLAAGTDARPGAALNPSICWACCTWCAGGNPNWWSRSPAEPWWCGSATRWRRPVPGWSPFITTATPRTGRVTWCCHMA
jgi:hypothetical protein